MIWLKNLFTEKDAIQPIKDTIVEHSNGVRINYSLYGRILSAKRTRNEITHFPNFINKNNEIAQV
jgi:hypothetical protein